MSCCPASRCSPYLTKGESGKGKFVDCDKFQAYVTGDASAKKAIVVLADIFNFKSGRHVGICDTLAQEGYYVIMPDLFDGTSCPMDDILGYIKNYPIEDVQIKLDKVYANLVPETCETIGMVGFCFGCWVIFHESSRNIAKLKCGVNCHPSVNIEGLFERTPDDLGKKINHPMLLVPCKDDHPSVQPGTFLEKEKTVEIIDMNHQAHGFVSQGDVDVEAIKKDVDTVMEKSLAYFQKHL